MMRFAKKEKILKVNNHKLGAEGGLWAGSRDPSPACCLLQGDLTPMCSLIYVTAAQWRDSSSGLCHPALQTCLMARRSGCKEESSWPRRANKEVEIHVRFLEVQLGKERYCSAVRKRYISVYAYNVSYM